MVVIVTAWKLKFLHLLNGTHVSGFNLLLLAHKFLFFLLQACFCFIIQTANNETL